MSPLSNPFWTETVSNPPALRTTVWHMDPEGYSDSDSELSSLSRPPEQLSSGVEGLQLLAAAARRVWEELFVCKKPVRV